MPQRDFPADVHAPAAARAFARSALAELMDVAVPRPLCDDVELIVSELVTNAVRAGSDVVHLDVQVRDVDGSERVVLRVTDAAEGWPQPREADIHDLGGRGLALVSAIAETWGVRMTHSAKTVWAELPLVV